MLKWIGRIIGGVVLLSLLGGLGTYIFVRDAVDGMYGGKAQTADLIASPTKPAKVIITNASVLAPSGTEFLTGHDVVLENETITFIGPNADRTGTPVIINADGQYLIPGLVDSHVHFWRSENDLLLYIANGVTLVREMHGTDLHLKWRSEINAGRLGPDLNIIAAQLATYDFAQGIWVDWTAERNVVRSDADVRRTVKSLLDAGFDGLKASSYLSRPAYQAASRETLKHEARFVGHIPVAANLNDLYASNQSEVAHVEEFVKALNREFGNYNSKNTEAFLTFVRERADDVAAKVKQNDIVVTSTLALVESFPSQMLDLDTALQGVELDYVNPGVTTGQAMGWLDEKNRYHIPESYRTGEWKQRYGTYWAAYGEAQKILYQAFIKADVTLFAGTDANVPVMVPGFSLHEELATMQKNGMTPVKALASATYQPAEWLGYKAGRIQTGYEANLMLLTENPLDDISATKSIDTVFVNGNLLNRSDLDQLLNTVKTANAHSR